MLLAVTVCAYGAARVGGPARGRCARKAGRGAHRSTVGVSLSAMESTAPCRVEPMPRSDSCGERVVRLRPFPAARAACGDTRAAARSARIEQAAGGSARAHA